MKNLPFNWYLIITKLLIAITFWFCDSIFIVLGSGFYVQTTLVLIYRWALYTPSEYDLKILLFLGLMSDVILIMPLGVHSFLYVLLYLFLQTQSRYLIIAQQYIRWFIFLGVLLLFNQAEWLLMFLLGKKITINLSVLFSVFITFALYPMMFRFLQYHD